MLLQNGEAGIITLGILVQNQDIIRAISLRSTTVLLRTPALLYNFWVL